MTPILQRIFTSGTKIHFLIDEVYFSEYYLNHDDQLAEMYAKRCLEYVETIEHGTRVLRLLKEKDKSMSVGKSFVDLKVSVNSIYI